MLLLSVLVNSNRIEVFGSPWVGKQSVRHNGKEVSRKQSYSSPLKHVFHVVENEENASYEITVRISLLSIRVHYRIRRNGTVAAEGATRIGSPGVPGPGETPVKGPGAYLSGTVKDAATLQTATRRADQEAELRRYKRFGIALVLGSYASFALPLALPIDPGLVFTLYISLSVIGVVFYAKAKRRRLWWGVIGLYPVLGPLLGFWILSWKPKTRTNMDFRGGSIASTIASIIGICLTSPWLIELGASIYLPEGRWYPEHQHGGGMLFFLLSPFILFIVVSVIVHLNKYEFASTSKLKPFLITEVVFVGLFLLSFFGTFYVTSKILDVHEVQSEKALSQLQVGMSRHSVETLVFEANAALIAPPREGWSFGTTEYQNERYRKVQQGLRSARGGDAVNFSIFSRKEYFVLEPDKGDPSTQRFRRVYILGPYHDDTYELLVNYDTANRLKSARYTSRQYSDGIEYCQVLMEVPQSIDRKYPHACSKSICAHCMNH